MDISKKQSSLILAVTIGSMLEWYDIYLYIYWAPIISKLFFSTTSGASSLIPTFLIFGVGFLARPIGGILFGRIGDLLGRKWALMSTIIMMIFPTFLMGLIPTYQEIGLWAPIIIVVLRVFQAFPIGGELPGAFCYLYEFAAPSQKRYLTSWGAVGNQIGILISMLECFLLEQYLSEEALINWGWRVSFIIGGLIGLFGFYLRYKLSETPSYLFEKEKKMLVRDSVFKVLYKNKNKISLAVGFCLFNSVGFYLISVLFPVYFGDVLNISYGNDILISMFFILLTTVPLPFIGMLGDRFSNKRMLIVSSISSMLLIYPMYYSVSIHSNVFSVVTSFLFILFFSCITALIPFRFADLFPTAVRFTCVGLSYNIVDGIFGGFSPSLALFLLNLTGSVSYFYWILFLTCLISLLCFFKINENKSVA